MKSTIKVLALSTVLMLAAAQVYGQKCKTGKDPITGETVTKTDRFICASAGWSNASVEQIWTVFNKLGGKYFVDADIYVVGDYKEKMFPNDDFIIKLDDGKTVTLNAENEASPVLKQGKYSWLSEYKVKFYVSAEDMQSIANSTPTFIRLSVSGKAKTYDLEVSKKYGKRTAKVANCIL
jgi:hypothetical protein